MRIAIGRRHDIAGTRTGSFPRFPWHPSHIRLTSLERPDGDLRRSGADHIALQLRRGEGQCKTAEVSPGPEMGDLRIFPGARMMINPLPIL